MPIHIHTPTILGPGGTENISHSMGPIQFNGHITTPGHSICGGGGIEYHQGPISVGINGQGCITHNPVAGPLTGWSQPVGQVNGNIGINF